MCGYEYNLKSIWLFVVKNTVHRVQSNLPKEAPQKRLLVKSSFTRGGRLGESNPRGSLSRWGLDTSTSLERIYCLRVSSYPYV